MFVSMKKYNSLLVQYEKQLDSELEVRKEHIELQEKHLKLQDEHIKVLEYILKLETQVKRFKEKEDVPANDETRH